MFKRTTLSSQRKKGWNPLKAHVFNLWCSPATARSSLVHDFTLFHASNRDQIVQCLCTTVMGRHRFQAEPGHTTLILATRLTFHNSIIMHTPTLPTFIHLTTSPYTTSHHPSYRMFSITTLVGWCFVYPIRHYQMSRT